jgi:hypothetical protein
LHAAGATCAIGLGGGLIAAALISGTAKGAVIGAAIGSAIPVVGTVVGAVIGAMGGGVFAVIATGALAGVVTSVATGGVGVGVSKAIIQGGKLIRKGYRRIASKESKASSTTKSNDATLAERVMLASEAACETPEDQASMNEFLNTAVRTYGSLPKYSQAPLESFPQSWIEKRARQQANRIQKTLKSFDRTVAEADISRQKKVAESACSDLIQLLVRPSAPPSVQEYASAFAKATFSAMQYTELRCRGRHMDGIAGDDQMEDLDDLLSAAMAKNGIDQTTAPEFAKTALISNVAFRQFNQIIDHFAATQHSHPGTIAAAIGSCVHLTFSKLAPQDGMKKKYMRFQRELRDIAIEPPASDVEHFTNLVFRRYSAADARERARDQLKRSAEAAQTPERNDDVEIHDRQHEKG